MIKNILPLFILVFLTSCAPQTGINQTDPGRGMGMSANGMMARHHAAVPDAYNGLSNPVTPDEASLDRGRTLYTVNCASCHGDGGMGDGPAGASLDPAPAPVAHSSQMMADDYLFWRISEGGTEFGTTMPGWKSLDENSRWDIINYMRALGSGTIAPSKSMGGAPYDPAIQAQHQDEILAEAVKQAVINQEESDTFKLVHNALEQFQLEHPETRTSGSTTTQRESIVLKALVDSGVITQLQADAFLEIHDRLGAAGLMP